jgi:hypothetical protein
MFLKGWFLLVIFLLMQVGSLAVSTCQTGMIGMPESGCAAATCCCADEMEAVSTCACAEAPVSEGKPVPVVPTPTTTGREAWTTPVWVEDRSCGLPALIGDAGALVRPLPSLAATKAVASVALVVRFCVFLI